jgi:spore coat polysaccharide biosynthesis predicted glycosyltransferase SpsG
MTGPVLLYADFDKNSGIGHIARTQIFYHAISKFSNEIYLCSKSNPSEIKLQFDFLSKVKWLPIEHAKKMTFSLSYIDSYDNQIIESFSDILASKRVILFDSNYKKSLPDWADLIIDLERTTPRHHASNCSYIFGVNIIGLDIQKLKKSRKKKRLKDRKIKRVVVNFGGSNRAGAYLEQLKPSADSNPDVDYVIFCAQDLIIKLEATFYLCKNVTLKKIGPEYFKELQSCNFLVSSSGVSFLEAIYLELPVVVFNLFDNAAGNFEKFHNAKNVLYYGQITDLSGNWQTLVNNKFTDYSPVRAKNETDFLRYIEAGELISYIEKLIVSS